MSNNRFPLVFATSTVNAPLRISVRLAKSKTSLSCAVLLTFVTHPSHTGRPSISLNAFAMAMTGWRFRTVFDGGTGTIASIRQPQPFTKVAAVSTISGTTASSPRFLSLYSNSPSGDRVVSNTGWPKALCPIIVLLVVCTSRAYPSLQGPRSLCGLILTGTASHCSGNPSSAGKTADNAIMVQCSKGFGGFPKNCV